MGQRKDILRKLKSERHSGQEIFSSLAKLVFDKSTSMTFEELREENFSFYFSKKGIYVEWDPEEFDHIGGFIVKIYDPDTFDIDDIDVEIDEPTLTLLYMEDQVTIEDFLVPFNRIDDSHQKRINSFLPKEFTFEQNVSVKSPPFRAASIPKMLGATPSKNSLEVDYEWCIRTEFAAFEVESTLHFREPTSSEGKLAFKANLGDDDSKKVLFDKLEESAPAIMNRIKTHETIKGDIRSFNEQLIEFLRNQI